MRYHSLVMDGRADAARGTSERSWVLDAVAGISDAIVIVDERGNLVYRNPAADRLVGMKGLASDPERWSDEHGLYRPDERTPFPPHEVPLVRAMAGEDVRDVGVFVRNVAIPDGIHVVASASPMRDAHGRIRGAVCIFRDVTLTRRHEAQLREGARQKKAILDNIPDMAWLKDERGRFVLVNQPFALAGGRSSPEDVVGLTDLDIWQKELAERYRADDAEIMQTRLRKRVEEPFVDAMGKRYWIETIKTCIVDDKNNVIGTTGISRDITERKRVEEDMRSTKDELEQRVLERTAELALAQENLVRQERLAVLGQLAGGVAHQIRNPLAAIMNASYVLKRHLSPEQHQDVEDAIRIIHDEVRHANIIITGLLDYARVRTPDRHPVSIVDLLERILDAEWLPKNVHIVRRLPDRAAVISEVDGDQLQGAIGNLVRNAVDAMPDGGDLTISLDVTKNEIVIRVTDTGAGISPHVRDHLFEPLHSTKPMGIGLGLVTARRFVEAHGGRIACVEIPSGACFEVRLPAR
jgi:PAS domain S-box-containing protein